MSTERDYTLEVELVAALQEGDEGAYAWLMDRYHKRLCLYALSLCREQGRAEDIVQNVLFRLWKTRDRLRPDASVRSYLYRSVYNEFLDQYKHRKFILDLERRYTESLNALVEEEDAVLERLIALMRVEIENLSPKRKEIFLLSKKEGLTNMEIAEHLKISLKTVENQMTSAFKQLREALGNKMEGILFLLFGVPQHKALSPIRV